MSRISHYIILGLSISSISPVAWGDSSTPQGDDGWLRRLDMLRSVPYVALSEDSVGEQGSGVVLSHPRETSGSYNLYCTRSTGETFVMDMEGRVVHRWQYLSTQESGSYHHALMLPEGDLLLIKQHSKLIRLNWDSQPIWEKRLAVHHDVTLGPNGTFYTIVRDHMIYRQMRVWFDAIVHLTAQGEELQRWSTFEGLDELKSVLSTRSFLDTVLDSALGGRPEEGPSWTKIKATIAKGRYDFDYFHLNTITVLPANDVGKGDARFQPGNLLVCFRNVNQIAVLERGTYRVLWAWGEGELEWPHHPTMLDNGHVLVFDNGVRREYSRVVELEPLSGGVVWEYRAPCPEDFYSPARGSAQRLPNGNTLICESDRGRAFEVTRKGEVVWLWNNPATQGERRQTVYRMTRLQSDEVEPLLSDSWWWWQ